MVVGVNKRDIYHLLTFCSRGFSLQSTNYTWIPNPNEPTRISWEDMEDEVFVAANIGQ